MKITDVRAMLLTAPIPKQHQYTSDLGTVVSQSTAIVVIETDEGITGYGEAKGTPVVMKGLIEHHLRPLVLGEDPTRVAYLWEKMFNGSRVGLALHYGRSMAVPEAPGNLMCAISGVDVALWDIAGKARGVPIYKLLGGEVRSRIRAYASGGHGWLGEIGDQFLGYVEKGFTACKMRVGGKDHPRMVAGSAARIKEAREAVGPDVEIMLDAHGSTGVTEAIKLAREVEQYDIAWYEEPVIYHNFPGMAEVRRATSIPIATGERLYSRWDFRDVLPTGIAVAQPDLSHAGGISEVRRIAAMAEAYDVVIAPHCPLGPIALAASLQIDLATPNFLIQEQSLGIHYNVGNDLLDYLEDPGAFAHQQGFIPLLTGPGLGITLNREAIARFSPK